LTKKRQFQGDFFCQRHLLFIYILRTLLAMPEYSNDCGMPGRDKLAERLDFMQQEQGKKSAMLLFTGAICGLVGFAFVGIIGQYHFSFGPLEVNFKGEPMASGRNFFPVSISDMVHDPNTPQGKCFFAFSMAAAMCILVSFHSYHLRNCYVGDDQGICGVSYLGLRSVLPPMGLILCSAVTMTPLKQATLMEKLSTGIHGFGAGLFLSGYVVFEIQCLCFSNIAHLDKERGEKTVRLTFVGLTVFAMAIQVLCTGVSMNGDKFGLCCSDKWQIPTPEDIALAQNNGYPGTAINAMRAMESNTPMLLNTANETILAITIAAYWGEALSGIFMICGLLAIWWYCPERKLDLKETFTGCSYAHSGYGTMEEPAS